MKSSKNSLYSALLLVLTVPIMSACQWGNGGSAGHYPAHTGSLDRELTGDLGIDIDSDDSDAPTQQPPPSPPIVHDAPPEENIMTITATPADAYVKAGEKFRFEVSVNSAEPVSYQWYQNGSVIRWATGPVLIKKAISVEDSGTYKVIISSESQQEIVSAQLTVEKPGGTGKEPRASNPAKIVSAPKSNTVNEGSSASFKVVARGTDLQYEWKKGGQILPVNGPELRFASVRAVDQATYHCRVWNQNNSVSCGNFSLTVNQKVAITQHPASATAYEGQDITLTVKATGSPAPTVNWFFNGKKIQSGTSSLKLGSVSRNQAGKYTCSVSNRVNQVRCNSATINVKKKVRITRHPNNQILNAGETLKLNVAATGDGPLEYKCFRNGQFAVASSNGNNLVIQNSKPSDSGQYHCTVSNDGSSATTSRVKVEVMEDRTRSITLRWAAPTKRENGAKLRSHEISNYIVYLSEQRSGPFETAQKVRAGDSSTELGGLVPGTYFLAISTVDKLGMESSMSEVARIKIK